MEKEVVGTIISVSTQWWFKFNTKPFRLHSLDGVVFPHIIKVKYNVNGRDYTIRKWVGVDTPPPYSGSTIKVFYNEDKPAKARIQI